MINRADVRLLFFNLSIHLIANNTREVCVFIGNQAGVWTCIQVSPSKFASARPVWGGKVWPWPVSLGH